MFEKLVELDKKFDSIEKEMTNPEVISNINKYNELNKNRLELEEPVNKYREYQKLKNEIADAKEMIESGGDKEFIQMAKDELFELQEKEEKTRQELMLLLIPVDPNDKKNVYLEIRSGTGGEEAALFARDLCEMYTRYAQNKKWKVEMVDYADADAGGFAKVILFIKGDEVYSKLKFESGTHRVQRVPSTEASGRIHTSAATVAIMPEVDEVDVKLDIKDIKVDTYRASGAGGQHVNKTDSAIRLTHLPTGIVVACQDGRSQHQNRDTAMKLLQAKIWDQQEEERLKKEYQTRKLQVGTGDRSEKIRTYNYPQGRITDHRIGLTLYRLEYIMLGDLDEIVEALFAADRVDKLNNI
ncbi:MAG: peptide chain release factor 1 [Candidatus Margulisbacteria bacterium GWF2_35_9]|nr:MAG: peptide chain release factor 1 [Candidatus Margulisbacteria bacterium GWF2_35_9]